MNLSFYTAAVGAKQQQQRLNVQANNIANISTYGYKAQKPSFSTLMYGSVEGADGAKLTCGSGAAMTMTDTDFKPAAIVSTGYALDRAIEGDGFFALFDPGTQEVSYTRDGSFTASLTRRENAAGEPEQVQYLSDGDGRFVLSDQGEVIEVNDGKPSNPVGVYTFENTDGMRRVGANRFVPVAKNGAVQPGAGTVVSGSLELSNADLAEQMTKVIEVQRSYSYALKMVETTDELENTANTLRT